MLEESDSIKIPVHSDGLYPISDLWHIEPCYDTIEWLQQQIGQLALEIANEIQCPQSIETIEQYFGYKCISGYAEHPTLALLEILATNEISPDNIIKTKHGLSLLHDLLLGKSQTAETCWLAVLFSNDGCGQTSTPYYLIIFKNGDSHLFTFNYTDGNL